MPREVAANRRGLLMLLAGGLVAATGPVDAAENTPYADAIGKLADVIEADYVFPDQGRECAQMLRRKLAVGDYAGITDAAAISDRLTADLRDLHHDLHFRVRVSGAAPTGSSAVNAAMPPMEGAAWLADGVAYIRFNRFEGSPETVATTRRFVQEHAGAKALIIDGRRNHGGGGDEINVMLPYLFATRTVVMDIELSRAVAAQMGFTADQFFHETPSAPGRIRFEQVVEPETSEHRLFNAKVFYLISSDTGSAGEALAFILKTTGRGTLVGEHTRGMDHFGRVVPISQGLEAFVPVGRSFDPKTGKNWEGGGVIPDVAVPSDTALAVATKLAQA
ncbi:MAG TPA: S41 family peptidase [Caulobacteraceae bacterium]